MLGLLAGERRTLRGRGQLIASNPSLNMERVIALHLFILSPRVAGFLVSEFTVYSAPQNAIGRFAHKLRIPEDGDQRFRGIVIAIPG